MEGEREELVVKRLRQSELGWFEACRQAGRETGRQRALNIDADVVAELFAPAAGVDHIDIDEQWWDGQRIVRGTRPLRLQHKNWRIAGAVVPGQRFETAQPEDIFLLHFVRAATGTRWSLTWELLSQCNSTSASIFEMARECLNASSCALASEEYRPRIVAAARRRLSAFGGDPFADTADLTDEDWETVTAWLRQYMTVQKLRAILRTTRAHEVGEVLRSLGVVERSRVENLAEEVLRRFGSDLLADRDRRELMRKARFPEARERPDEVTHWHRGERSALQFTMALGLPPAMAGTPVEKPEDFEDVDAFRPLGDLHEYQKTLAEGIRSVLRADAWERRRAIAWLPTGTGKTRVTVETVLMECALEAPRNCVLWVADREELCEQAVETFRHVWMVQGLNARCARDKVAPPLRIVRLWGGREWREPPAFPTVIVASIQTLATRLENQPDSFGEEGDTSA